MNLERPNPDELLARLKKSESGGGRGKLKIFFGYAAGVGKTYAMLEAARREKAVGVDVVVGYVEPHGRPDTEALLQGLDALPSRIIPYRNVTLREFDLDAALKRHPQLLLVDELAHTNAEGSRHAKRWQDVAELLVAGINVYTTLNVQHLESLNDVIAQISGIIVHERLPDSILEVADDIELVDLTPEELIERLKAGKVYLPEQAERALVHFFQKSNLQALRELSLRQAAFRLRCDVDQARELRAARAPWATSERLLVCVGPSPTTARLIRATKRMAAAFGGDWLAVAVETPTTARTPALRPQIAEHMRLAEQLGAETQTLVGANVADTVLEYARSRNVTKIIVGKTAKPWWSRWFFRTVVDQLLDKSGDVDVYVITGEGQAPRPPRPRTTTTVPWLHYTAAVAVVAVCTLLAWASYSLGHPEANTVMLFLLGVVFVGYRFGRGPAVAASAVSVLVFDFFFVEPLFRFTVSDARYFLTFAALFVIGFIISTLTGRINQQLQTSQQLERRTSALFRLARQMSQVAGHDFLIGSAGKQLGEIFDAEVVIYTRQPDSQLAVRFGKDTSVAQNPKNAVVAEWVAQHDETAGAGTDTLPSATALFIPLIGSQSTLGAIGIKPSDAARLQDPGQRHLAETCAGLMALSLERDQSVLEASEAELRLKTEQLRSSLLSSVSHDLRTPLATIVGASSTLLQTATDLDLKTRRELVQTILGESRRLTRLVDNLLEMTRFESGAVVPSRQWHVVEEIVGGALGRLQHELQGHSVHVDIAPNLPLAHLDGVLLEQALVNLLENAARHTPAGTSIEIRARQVGKELEIAVADNGPGLPAGSEDRVFEKFVRGQANDGDQRRGVGLGLSICRAAVQVHGGTITAHNRSQGGAEFIISLPQEQDAPRVAVDEVQPWSLP